MKTLVFNYFLFFQNHAVYEIMLKNTVKPDKSQMTIWSMRIAGWISKATNTHSEYVILLSTTTVVVRTRLNIALYLFCLSCKVLLL